MTSLDTLKNTSIKRKAVKRVGRGLGSGKGKTCGRGEKGAGSRSGYTHRYGYEGGQFRTFMKLPIRGFSNARFRKEVEIINLGQINEMYNDGEVVNADTLIQKGFIKPSNKKIKVLAKGKLTKKVSIEVDAISQKAHDDLKIAKIHVKLSNS